MSVAVKSYEFVFRDWRMEPLAAQREVEGRVQGLKVKAGHARAAAKRAETLEEKVALYELAKSLVGERDLLHRNYWTEVDKLVFGTERSNARQGGHNAKDDAEPTVYRLSPRADGARLLNLR